MKSSLLEAGMAQGLQGGCSAPITIGGGETCEIYPMKVRDRRRIILKQIINT